MISPLAVQNFMQRPRRDSSQAKKYSRNALIARLAKLDPVPDFYTEPRKHQIVQFLLGAMYGSYGCFLDPGLGKSKIMLDLFRWFRRRGEVTNMLVCVPNTVNVDGWIREAQVHAPDCTASGSPGSDILIVTYATFLRMSSQLVAVSKKRNKYAPDPKVMKANGTAYQMIVFDESPTYLRNHTSATYRCCRKTASFARRVYILTGTPFSKNPEDLWSQMHLVDWGESIGETLGLFRAAFCDEKQAWFGGGFEYKFRKELTGTLRRFLRHRSLYYLASECEDLPPLIPSTRRIALSKEAFTYYDRVMTGIRESHAQGVEVRENSYHKLRLLVSGILSEKVDDYKVESLLKPNAKMDALLELLSEFPLEQKVIVFCEYVATGAMICEGLKAAKIPHLRLYGGTTDKGKVVRDFTNNPKHRVLVCGAAAGGTGTNLQVANRMIFFETPSSPMVRTQCIKRIERIGQKQTMFVYDLLAKSTIDERIYRALREGKDLFEQILAGKEKL